MKRQRMSPFEPLIPGEKPFESYLPDGTDRPPGGLSGTHVLPPGLPAEFEEAACRDASLEDQKRFFVNQLPPYEMETAQVHRTREYLWNKFCKPCPVKERCFRWAMAYEELGIWAGTVERERHLARRDEEMLEYGRNRIKAGYQPWDLSNRCTCGEIISPSYTHCRSCAGAAKKKLTHKLTQEGREKGYAEKKLVAYVKLKRAELIFKRWETGPRATYLERRDAEIGMRAAEKKMAAAREVLEG